MTTRRCFLAGILAAGVAPFIVRAESLMAVRVPKSGIITYQIQNLPPANMRHTITGLTSGVTLPTALAGQIITINNASDYPLTVFADAHETIIEPNYVRTFQIDDRRWSSFD
ncbi:MAG: hypothetical protein WC073_11455 [Sterolibacterium sp.]